MDCAGRIGTLVRIELDSRASGGLRQLFVPAQQRSKRLLTEQREDVKGSGSELPGFISLGNKSRFSRLHKRQWASTEREEVIQKELLGSIQRRATATDKSSLPRKSKWCG